MLKGLFEGEEEEKNAVPLTVPVEYPNNLKQNSDMLISSKLFLQTISFFDCIFFSLYV